MSGKKKASKELTFDTGRVLVGSCLERLKDLADGSVDSIVTDPPYELGFMGKAWDASGIAYNVELWRECMRVLKPGGHLLAFGGTRTYHRMTVAIEDAGFEIRDSIHWLYGSGFPKSLDVSKAIDKVNGEPDRLFRFTRWMRTTGLTARQLDEITGTNMGKHYLTAKSQPAIPTAAIWSVIRPHVTDVPEWVDELVGRIEAEREVVGTKTSGIANKDEGSRHTIGAGQVVEVAVTAPATDAAKQWSGWGTALKPAHEPIVLARKPLTGTVAQNVLQHGTGALNIDGCRVGDEGGCRDAGPTGRSGEAVAVYGDGLNGRGYMPVEGLGRWPANIITDGSIDDDWTRYFYVAKPSKKERNAGLEKLKAKTAGEATDREDGSAGLNSPRAGAGRTGGSRNFHPTVKPVALMRYLVRLVTPPNGTVLDPFLGSGTTAVAAILEGFTWVGCEMTTDYLLIIKGRVTWAEGQQQTLFEGDVA